MRIPRKPVQITDRKGSPGRTSSPDFCGGATVQVYSDAHLPYIRLLPISNMNSVLSAKVRLVLIFPHPVTASWRPPVLRTHYPHFYLSSDEKHLRVNESWALLRAWRTLVPGDPLDFRLCDHYEHANLIFLQILVGMMNRCRLYWHLVTLEGLESGYPSECYLYGLFRTLC